MTPPTIYQYIKQEETSFESDEVQVGDNWYWNFRNHVQLIFHLKNGIFYTGENNWLRAFKNIMEPMLNLAYWIEDLEVKDVVFFIEEATGKVLSFLIKKYHDEVYTREHDLDKLFDDITESDLDYGGVLVQEAKDCPEVIKLKRIAFCDQTDILGGPVGFKYYFSPDKLRSMSKYGWGDDKNGATISLDELCTLATFEKDIAGSQNKKGNKVPGKTIEVYIVRGNLPQGYLKDDNNMEDYYNQIQIVAFYVDEKKEKQGVTLYRKKSDESSLKFFTSREVEDRALGRGVGETLLHPQIWTNFLTIHKTGLIEAASKITLYTDDTTYTNKNRIQDMENLEITTIEEGKEIHQTPNAAPTNIELHDNDIAQWYNFAQTAASANDPLLGEKSISGTTFRGQNQLVTQGRGIHDRRRGQRAKFIEEIYRDWIIPEIKKEILDGKKFMATLSMEEMTWITEQLATNLTNQKIVEMAIKTGQLPTPDEQTALIESTKSAILKKGNKHLLEILKGEFKDVEIKMGIDIAGKQKDLAGLSDKLLSIFQFIFQNPTGFQQAMQIPALAKSFQNILEASGMSIADFSSLLQAPAQPIQSPIQQGQLGQGQQQPLTLSQPNQ